jgi:zinc transporter ZupT
VSLLGKRVPAWQPALVGFAAGVMMVASVIGLLQPALAAGALVMWGLGAALSV